MAGWEPFFALFFGYLLGSIPFGVLLTRAAGAGDLRTIGSGNIGATNVLRTGRKGLAAITLLLDAAKGLFAVLLAGHLLPGQEIWTAAGAFFGHLYPIWLRFKGGKGVATYGGILFALSWPLGAAYTLIWVAAVVLTRISSAGGLLAALSAPIAAFITDKGAFLPILLACSIIIFWKHRENIQRLMQGTEPRIGQK